MVWPEFLFLIRFFYKYNWRKFIKHVFNMFGLHFLHLLIEDIFCNGN